MTDNGPAYRSTLFNKTCQALVTKHTYTRTYGRHMAAQQHLHLVLTCERLAPSGGDAELTLDDIARRSGCSRRALELIFNRCVGMPPGP